MTDGPPRATDWRAWHDDYADPTSALSRRLALVRGHIDAALDDTTLEDTTLEDTTLDDTTLDDTLSTGTALDGRADTEVTVVSACAGQGHDVLGVLGRRADAARVRATLIEFDPGNVRLARATAARLALQRVEVRCADAGELSSYEGAVPADLVVFTGIFGNISHADIERSIAALPQLCASGATVIWTRTRRPPDVTTHVRRWFADVGFAEVAFHAPEGTLFSVGVHRLRADSQPLAGGRIFEFLSPGTATGPD